MNRRARNCSPDCDQLRLRFQALHSAPDRRLSRTVFIEKRTVGKPRNVLSRQCSRTILSRDDDDRQ